MIDTSVMVAGLVPNHEFHARARPHVAAAARGQVPGIVLAQTRAALRRAPWDLDARTVATALARWSDQRRIVATSPATYAKSLRRARTCNLGGSMHDLLIALTCRDHDLPLVTLDRRPSTLAAGIEVCVPHSCCPTRRPRHRATRKRSPAKVSEAQAHDLTELTVGWHQRAGAPRGDLQALKQARIVHHAEQMGAGVGVAGVGGRGGKLAAIGTGDPRSGLTARRSWSGARLEPRDGPLGAARACRRPATARPPAAARLQTAHRW